MTRPSAARAIPFSRPSVGPRYKGPAADLAPSGESGWRSRGGTGRAHPARLLPPALSFSLEPGTTRVRLLGVFALCSEGEPVGTHAACLVTDSGCLLDLTKGRHYDVDLAMGEERTNGDGSSLLRVGETVVDGVRVPVDLLSVDLAAPCSGGTMTLRTLGSAASFVVFDVFAETPPAARCPFHTASGGVPIEEVGPALKRGDRVAFERAERQFLDGIERAEDIDEARGQAVTFLAVVTAAMLELGGSRELHREILESARALDRLGDRAAIAAEARRRTEIVAAPALRERCGPSDHLVDRALSMIDRQYARRLTDESVAGQLGLSTSHFRHLFRQTTGQPFHRYLTSLRLEKAHRMLREEGLPVSTVARAVGFGGLSHFSRAFAQRYSIPPTAVRRTTS
jgi:AraC-like DNA-binding protein